MKVMLVAFKPDGTRVDFRVRDGRCVIGRDTDADLRIPVGTVSRQHCEVRVDEDEPLVRDLGSSNGTFLNGKRVTESVLDAGDLLRVGPTTFTVVVDGIPDVVVPPSDREQEPEGSSMMEAPTRPAKSAAPSAMNAGSLVSDDEDEEEEDEELPSSKPARAKAPPSEPSDDPFSKMVERQDDDDDFDFDFFDDDEDEDDDR